MQNTIQNYRVFTVKYLADTDRVSITESLSKTCRKTLDYDYRLRDTREIATKYLQSLGINIVGCGETKDACILFSDSWDKGHGFINIKGEKQL